MERNLYHSGVITIDQSVAQFGNSSYPIRNIGAVSIDQIKNGSGFASLVYGLFAVLLGLAALGMIGSDDATGITVVITAALAFFSGLWAVKSWPKRQHVLMLNTSSGNIQAYSSDNLGEIAAIRDAILSAVTQMGKNRNISNGS